MGDLNVAADYPVNAASTATEYGSYQRFALRPAVLRRPVAGVLHRTGRHERLVLALEKARRIDYVFLSPPPTIGPVLAPTEISVEPFLMRR